MKDKEYMEDCRNFYHGDVWDGEEKEPACSMYNLNKNDCSFNCKEYSPELKVGQTWYVMKETNGGKFPVKKTILDLTKKTILLCPEHQQSSPDNRKLIKDIDFIEYIKG